MKPRTTSYPLFNPALEAAGHAYPFDTAVTGLVGVTDGPIAFTPVPRLRKRRDGWTPETQRAFIDLLAECACVTSAARAVGMTPRSAYRLLDCEGADSFAEAWDQAMARGLERLREAAMDRAFKGSWVPVIRRGMLVRMEKRPNDKLAIALLSGRSGRSAIENRERASSRRKYRLQLLDRERREDEERARAEAVWAEHQAVLDRIEAERENPPPRSATAPPRVRGL